MSLQPELPSSSSRDQNETQKKLVYQVPTVCRMGAIADVTQANMTGMTLDAGGNSAV